MAASVGGTGKRRLIMTDKEIRIKIRKLLELSKSPNENEAAAALQKANTLMGTYYRSNSLRSKNEKT